MPWKQTQYLSVRQIFLIDYLGPETLEGQNFNQWNLKIAEPLQTKRPGAFGSFSFSFFLNEGSGHP